MGWYYGEESKQEVIDDITKGWRNEETGNRNHTLAKSVRGNVLYTVQECLTYENGVEKSERYIGIFLLGQSGGSWGYKPMDEGMGPYYYDCPLSFFKLAPIVPSGYAAEWREKVRAHHAKKAMKRGAKVGDTIVFKDGVRFHGQPLEREKVTMVSGTKLYIIRFGVTVRVTPKHIERIERA